MTDFDSIWRTQDEIRTVVNAVLGECIWNLSYNEHRMGIELELTQYLEEEIADMLINQFPVAADYDVPSSCSIYNSSQSISENRENLLPSRSMVSKNIFSGRTQYFRSP